MTGPSHYREAQKDLEYAAATDDRDQWEYYVAAAQVHATLALVAATAEAAGITHGELSITPWGKAIES